jgi:hypothetical protein
MCNIGGDERMAGDNGIGNERWQRVTRDNKYNNEK